MPSRVKDLRGGEETQRNLREGTLCQRPFHSSKEGEKYRRKEGPGEVRVDWDPADTGHKGLCPWSGPVYGGLDCFHPLQEEHVRGILSQKKKC